MASTEEITESLSDLLFPATRESIIKHAEAEGATDEVINDLRTLPVGEYGDIMDVWDHLGLINTAKDRDSVTSE